MRATLRSAALGLVAALGWMVTTIPAADVPKRADTAERQAAMRSAKERRTTVQERGAREIPYIVLFLEYWEKADCERACNGFKGPIFVFDRLTLRSKNNSLAVRRKGRLAVI